MDYSGKHILIVDDDDFNIMVLKELLADCEGAKVTSVLSAEAALQVIEAEMVSLILLDRMMPEMDGIELTQKLRSTTQTANIPIVMQSAAATKDQVEEGLQSGVDAYLTKPFKDADLMELVEKHIR